MTIDEVIGRFLAVWGEPKSDHAEQFLAEYRRSLAGTAGDVLEAAANSVIDNEDYWPRPAALRRHVGVAAARLQARRKPAEHQPIERTPPSPEQAARAALLVAEAKRALASIPDAFAPPRPLPPADRTAFSEMQRRSMNVDLHTERSRQMTGEG